MRTQKINLSESSSHLLRSKCNNNKNSLLKSHESVSGTEIFKLKKVIQELVKDLPCKQKHISFQCTIRHGLCLHILPLSKGLCFRVGSSNRAWSRWKRPWRTIVRVVVPFLACNDLTSKTCNKLGKFQTKVLYAK